MTDHEAPVVDDPANDRFVVDQDGTIAQLTYQAGDDRLVLTHTEVPEEIGGRGIAGRLVRAATGRAVRDGLTVVPWCPYARTWLQDHPDVADTIAIDWTPQADCSDPGRPRTQEG